MVLKEYQLEKKKKTTNENKISIENYYKAFDFDRKLIAN